MKLDVIQESEVVRRDKWVSKLVMLSGNFAADAKRLEKEIEDEVRTDGIGALLTHLRLGGVIPERYSHDSSEEKLYSKYTDALLAASFQNMGLRSLIITARADVADVEGFAKTYSFVADAKAFRLSRTAKNQKDFKVQAMDNWKHGKQHAVLVAPIYQYPSRTSQIYQQAIGRDVCLLGYPHLATLVAAAHSLSIDIVLETFERMLKVVATLRVTKQADTYWQAINSTMLTDQRMRQFWVTERKAALDSIKVSQREALTCVAEERERIMRLSHRDALGELIKLQKIESKEATIRAVSDNGLMEN